MPRSLFRAAIAAIVLLSVLASYTSAHAQLISATPGPGDVVSSSPREIVARFDQNLDPSRTSLEIRDASGAVLARGGEAGTGPREWRLTLPNLSPGEYTVRWTSFSAEDGELGRDTYTFKVVAPPSPSPTPSASPPPSVLPSAAPATPAATPAPTPAPSPTAPDGSAGSGGAVLIPMVAGLVVIGAIGVWLMRRRSA